MKMKQFSSTFRTNPNWQDPNNKEHFILPSSPWILVTNDSIGGYYLLVVSRDALNIFRNFYRVQFAGPVFLLMSHPFMTTILHWLMYQLYLGQLFMTILIPTLQSFWSFMKDCTLALHWITHYSIPTNSVILDSYTKTTHSVLNLLASPWMTYIYHYIHPVPRYNLLHGAPRTPNFAHFLHSNSQVTMNGYHIMSILA